MGSPRRVEASLASAPSWRGTPHWPGAKAREFATRARASEAETPLAPGDQRSAAHRNFGEQSPVRQCHAMDLRNIANRGNKGRLVVMVCLLGKPPQGSSHVGQLANIQQHSLTVWYWWYIGSSNTQQMALIGNANLFSQGQDTLENDSTHQKIPVFPPLSGISRLIFHHHAISCYAPTKAHGRAEPKLGSLEGAQVAAPHESTHRTSYHEQSVVPSRGSKGNDSLWRLTRGNWRIGHTLLKAVCSSWELAGPGQRILVSAQTCQLHLEQL